MSRENASPALDENALLVDLSIMCGISHIPPWSAPLMKFQRRPLQFALFYLMASALWIVGSDALLLGLGFDRDTLSRYQSLKGFAFVLLSALVLYAVLARHWREQWRVRRELKESEERLALALDSAQEGMWDWDMKSQRVFYSPRYCALLGYSPEEFGQDQQAWVATPVDSRRVRYASVDGAAFESTLAEIVDELYNVPVA